MAKRSEAVRQAKRRAQKRAVSRAKVEVDVNAHAPYSGEAVPAPKDWKKEERKRLDAEVKAIEKELSGFDPVKAAALVRSSLEIELKRKKLRIEENALDQSAS